MNTQQAENLRILIRHMETGCQRDLNMGMFFHPCGTPACALGEAAVCIPALAAQGLVTTEDLQAEWAPLHAGYNVGPVLGVGHHDALRLFGNHIDNVWKNNDVTPQEWAVEARKVLCENGYSMDEPKPAQTFQSFMAKALEPVDTAGVIVDALDVSRIR